MLRVRKLGSAEIIQDYRVRQAVEPLTVLCYPPREALLSLKRKPLLAWLPSWCPGLSPCHACQPENTRTQTGDMGRSLTVGRGWRWLCGFKVWFLLLMGRKGQSQVRSLLHANHTLKALPLGMSLHP